MFLSNITQPVALPEPLGPQEHGPDHVGGFAASAGLAALAFFVSSGSGLGLAALALLVFGFWAASVASVFAAFFAVALAPFAPFAAFFAVVFAVFPVAALASVFAASVFAGLVFSAAVVFAVTGLTGANALGVAADISLAASVSELTAVPIALVVALMACNAVVIVFAEEAIIVRRTVAGAGDGVTRSVAWVAAVSSFAAAALCAGTDLPQSGSVTGSFIP
jgi:hypothetical protein